MTTHKTRYRLSVTFGRERDPRDGETSSKVLSRDHWAPDQPTALAFAQALYHDLPAIEEIRAWPSTATRYEPSPFYAPITVQ